MDQQVNEWLGRVSMWSQTTCTCISGRVNEAERDDLRSFLQRLHSQLHQWDNPSVVSENLPSLGRLLRCLCSSELLMLHEADYQLVMRCVLAFYTNQPCNPLEEKAQKWAQAQLRHSVSYYKESDPSIGVAKSISCPVSSYNQVASLTVVESIVREINQVPSIKWDSTTNCLVPSNLLSNDTLMNLSELCLPLVTSGVDGIVPLTECLLSCHGNSSGDALSLAFFEAITKSQKGAYTKKSCLCDLSYEGQVSLWTRYLPAFESEFLQLVEALIPLLTSPVSETTAKQLVSSRQIARACVENSSLLAAVNSWLELLVQQSKNGTFVFALLNLICECLREYRSLLPALCCCCYSTCSSIDSLCSQLQVNPCDLPVGLFIQHINNISNCLCRIHLSADHSTRIRAWFVLAKYQAWYCAVVRLLLLGTLENHPPCLNIITWYNIPLVPSDHQQYKAQLSEVAISLRALCNKSNLLSRDFLYAFSHLVAPHSHGTWVKNIVRPLCMLFAVYARGAHLILQDIIKMTTGGEQPNATSSFVFLLDSVEFALGGASEQKHQSCQAESRALTRTLQLLKENYDENLTTGICPASLDLQKSLQARYNRVCRLLA